MTVKNFISTYRIFPRLFTIAFFYVTYYVFEWFMVLEEPNNAQAGFVVTLAGGLVYAMKAYSDNGIKVKINKQDNITRYRERELQCGVDGHNHGDGDSEEDEFPIGD